MPKALLINPRPLEFEMLESVSIPFSVLYLGTYLKKRGGWDVRVIDGMTEPTERSYRAKVVEEAKKADVVGFSVMTPHIADAVETTRLVRKHAPDAVILWGGIHPTLFPDQTLRHPDVDFIAYGEGEDALLNFAKALEAGGDVSKVPAIGYKKDGTPRLNPFGTTVDVSDLPVPDYSLLERFHFYVAPREYDGRKWKHDKVRQAQIHCGRGCPYDCTFCINTVYDMPALRKHRAFPAQRIYDEMKWFRDTHGCEYFALQDELFFVNKERLDELIALLERNPLGVRWDTNPRVNFFNEAYITEPYLERLRAVGYDHFSLAVESGSTRVLQILKKNIKVEKAVEAVGLVHKHGMRVSTSFMIGIPGEEREDMYKSLKLGIRLYWAADGQINYFGPQIFRPYPGAELFEKAKRCGLKTPSSLDEWATVAVNPYFGFLQTEYLPWLDAEKRSDINFIIKYFTVVLRSRLDRTIFLLPKRVIPVAILLHLLLRLRRAFGEYDRFWFVERSILNFLTPFERLHRQARFRLRRWWREMCGRVGEASTAAEEYAQAA